MAGVIRDIVDAQAPGVFFGEGSTGVNYTQLIKEGPMEKLGRGRGLISSILGKKWAARNFKLHEDKKVYYFDGTTPRGELSIGGAKITRVKKEDADGREFAFEIAVGDEKVLVACETEAEMKDWMAKLDLVASGRWTLYKWTDLVAEYGKIPLQNGQKIDVEIDEENLKAVMSADGYGAERMIEIVEEYLKELYSKVARFVAEDEEFSVLLRRKMFAYRIRICKCADSDTSKGYYRTAFNAEGELEIQFIKAWTNLNGLGDDLVYSISVGEDVPYVVAKSVRQRLPFLNAMLQSYEQLLGVTGIKYDYCIKENMAAMVAADYDANRFAEIMFQEHLTPLIQRLARFIGEDPQFKTDFNGRFTGKTIIIKPAANPDSCKHYYNSSWTAEGNLLIQYKRFWCNLSEIGNDIAESLISGGSYEAQKSIRRYTPTMEAFLKGIENLFGITGVTYDYCYDENFAAMIKANYGEDRFGEIFLHVHLEELVKKMTSFMSQDYEFRNAFSAKFTGKKIIIKPAADPSAVKNYYDSKFVNGNLVIEYRSCWTNLNCLGQDLESIL
jgi:hypothetical protein